MKKLSFVVSLPTDNNYQREQAAAATAAAQRAGAEVRVLYAGGDPVLQSQQLLEIIQSRTAPRPDAMIVEPLTQIGLPHVAEAAVAAGIGWMISNSNVEYMQRLRQKAKVPVGTVTQPHADVGRVQAQQVAALLPDGGTVLYIQGTATSSVSVQRLQGFQQQLPSSIRLKTIKAQWTEESALQSVSSWLRLGIARPEDIGVITSQSNDFSLGARRACQNHERPTEKAKWLKIPFTAVGIPSQSKPLVDKRVLAAAVLTATTTNVAVELLMSALQTHSQPPERTIISVSSYPALEQLAGQQKMAVAASEW